MNIFHVTIYNKSTYDNKNLQFSLLKNELFIEEVSK